MEKSQYLLTGLLHVFFLGFALEEMLVYWQWSWTRLLQKSKAGVGVVSLIQGWTSCLLLPLQLLQGTRNLKESFLPSAFME